MRHKKIDVKLMLEPPVETGQHMFCPRSPAWARPRRAAAVAEGLRAMLAEVVEASPEARVADLTVTCFTPDGEMWGEEDGLPPAADRGRELAAALEESRMLREELAGVRAWMERHKVSDLVALYSKHDDDAVEQCDDVAGGGGRWTGVSEP